MAAHSDLFIADVHLGKLAKFLRMLAFDTVYRNDLTNKQLVQIALSEDRVLLSRRSYFKEVDRLRLFHIEDENAEVQLKKLVRHFHLKNKISAFTRCIVCNGILQIISKKEILSQLQPNTIKDFNEFWQYQNCQRIYWKGSHYDRMVKWMERNNLQ